MGLFSGSKKGISKKPVQEWTQEQVLRWLVHLGKDKYADHFKAVSGKRLVQLSAADLYQLVDTKLDADLLLDAISDLRVREGLEPVKAAKAAEPGFVTKPLPPVHTGINGLGKLTVPGSSGSRTPNSSVTPTNPAKRGAAENAEMLSSLVGSELVGELFEYMSFLGIQGMGLVEATERTPIIGHIIGALWELHDQASEAKGNRSNCQQLDSYGQDILRVFDAEGKRLAFTNNEALSKILQLVEQGITIVESYCKPGWLVKMATSERSIEDFQAVHNGILEKLRAEKIDTLPNGRQLTYGEYRDCSRPLRRCLKQLGSGSLDQGMAAALTNEKALAEVAQLIGVETPAILRDLQHVSGHPELDLLSTQDHSSLSGGGEYSPMSPVAGRNREYQTIFSQYDKNKSGALEFEELRSVLADLGLLDGVKPTEIESYTLQQFALADVDQDNRVDYEEFVNYYQSIATTKARRQLRSAMGPQAEKDLKKIFHSFASFGIRQSSDELDGARFSKLCRDCKLLGRTFTTIDVDLIFAKTKAKGQRRIDFDGFLSALGRVAEKKGLGLESVVRQILSAGGPTVTGTKAEYVKFHDDKSTYTGVYSRGGPSNVEPSRELSDLLDRSEADVRGVKKRVSGAGDPPLSARGLNSARLSTGGSEPPLTSRSRRESSGTGEVGSRLRGPSSTGESKVPSSASGTPKSTTPKSMDGSAADAASPLAPATVSPRGPAEGSFCAPDAIKRISKDAGSSQKVPPLPIRPVSQQELKAVFEQFARFGSRTGTASPAGPVEMEGPKFAKLCRECGLIEGKLTATAADLIFSKVKPKGSRRIRFRDFEQALEQLATEKGVPLPVVQHRVVSSGGPKRTGTTPTSHVRLHDDKASYTGVYKAGGPSVIDKHITLESLTDRTNTNTPPNRPRMQL